MRFLALAALALTCSASPTPQESPKPREGLLTIIGFFTAPKCNKSHESWWMSTGVETWVPYMAPRGGCQAINKDWDVVSVQVGWLGEKCSVSIYTDTDCKENGVTPVFETCATNSAKWKSFSILGCTEIAKHEAGEKDS